MKVKRERNRGLIIVVMALLMLSVAVVAGCGEKASGDIAKECVGTWKLDSIESGGETLDASSLSALGMEAALELTEDNNAAFVFFGEQLDGTWEKKNDSTITVTFEGEGVDAKISDGRLSLEMDGDKLIFKK
ncbi:hypothetical protein LJC55_04000 [Eubacteriales bacterium OttesenSCG-928-N14]|nr:hypothetical protein [Eubacteriales bacterium OttesenSCG-928-N14]